MTANVEHFQLHTDDGIIAVAVEFRHSPKARRVKLSVQRNKTVRLTIPRGVHHSSAVNFLHEKANWLAHTLARTKPAQTIATHLEKFPWVSVAGKMCSLECAETTARPFHVFREGEELVLFRHRGGAQRDHDLLALLRSLAAKTLPSRVALLAAKVSVPFQRVSVRNQEGRWGSCSTQGTVSLNWRLVLLPPALQDYVILHELAHCREMNHSERFWTLVASWDAEWEQHDRALTKQWGYLMDVGRDKDA